MQYLAAGGGCKDNVFLWKILPICFRTQRVILVSLPLLAWMLLETPAVFRSLSTQEKESPSLWASLSPDVAVTLLCRGGGNRVSVTKSAKQWPRSPQLTDWLRLPTLQDSDSLWESAVQSFQAKCHLKLQEGSELFFGIISYINNRQFPEHRKQGQMPFPFALPRLTLTGSCPQ